MDEPKRPKRPQRPNTPTRKVHDAGQFEVDMKEVKRMLIEKGAKENTPRRESSFLSKFRGLSI